MTVIIIQDLKMGVLLVGGHIIDTYTEMVKINTFVYPYFKNSMQPILILISLILLLGMGTAYSQEYTVPQDQEPTIIPNEFIVTFYEPTGFISGELVFEDVTVQLQSLETYTGMNQVFLVKTDESNLSIILSDSRVKYVQPNVLYHLTGFSGNMPFGMDRIEADKRTNYANGIDDAIDADVAVMDTGIRQINPDYNIVVCIDFTSSGTCTDMNGHGSHTAGTVGAIDNGGNNIIGVAEGVRLHILKVCLGGCPLNALIAAADYVTANADVIDVVNMSLGGGSIVTNRSCTNVVDAWQQAICNGYEKGVVYVVSAGNSNADSTDKFVPCTWDSTLCVSAITDSDGKAGGVGGPPACRPAEPDDRLVSFSNFGEVVRITAPGVCVKSYDANGNVWTISGTSMSSPHVAGAAALATIDFLNPTDAAGVEQVRQFLINEGFPRDSPNGWTGDKDSFAEPLVQVAFGQTPPPDDDTTPPRSGIWKPRNADTVTETITVSFWAVDPENTTPILTCFEVDGTVQECKNPGTNGIDTHFSWDTTGVSDGTHTLGGEVCDSVPNCVFVPTIDVLVTNLSLEDRVAQNTAHIDIHHQAHQTTMILGEDGGNLGIIIVIVVVIFGVVITIIVRIGQRKG